MIKYMYNKISLEIYKLTGLSCRLRSELFFVGAYAMIYIEFEFNTISITETYLLTR